MDWWCLAPDRSAAAGSSAFFLLELSRAEATVEGWLVGGGVVKCISGVERGLEGEWGEALWEGEQGRVGVGGPPRPHSHLSSSLAYADCSLDKGPWVGSSDYSWRRTDWFIPGP